MRPSVILVSKTGNICKRLFIGIDRMGIIPPEAPQYALIHVDREIDYEKFRADIETHMHRLIRVGGSQATVVAVVDAQAPLPGQEEF